MTRPLPEIAPKWPYLIAKFASALAIIAGASSLIGWTFLFWLPESTLDILLSTKPNAAICFILCGVALWIRCEMNKFNTFHIAEICSGAVFLISVLTLFQYLFSIDLGIDQGVFSVPLAHVTDFLPAGRMSPFSAINFALLSFSLFFMDSKIIRFQAHQLILCIMIVNSYFELLASLYNIGSTPTTIGFFSYFPLAKFPTVITFLFLGIGALFARPYKGITAILSSGTIGGVLARRIIPPMLLLPIVLGYLELFGSRAQWYSPEIGATFLILSIVIIFAILVLIYAHLVNKFDVSRQQAEFALKRSQMQLQAILDQASAIISIYDLEGRLSLVNKQFERSFHLSSAEVLGRKIHDVFPEPLAQQISKTHAEVMKTRMPIAVEESIDDGEESRTYLSNKFPIFDTQGIPAAVCNIATDVTEINKMHEVISEREERLTLALKSADAGTWMWDIPHDKVTWDEFLYHLFGLKPGTMSGHYTTMLNFIHPDDRQHVDDETKKALERGTEYQAEFRIIRNDGTIRYMATRGQVHRDNTGLPIRMAGVSWDITERKHNEVELEKAKETAELLADEAKAANQAKSAFLATMSHEIRTPLSGIIGMTELMMDTPLSMDQHKSLETIRSSGEALLSVINNILDFSKIESERMELENVRFDLHALVEDTVELLAMEVHRKGIAIGTCIESDVPQWLNGDPGKLRQIIVNLLSNAGKFTDSGEIGLRVKCFPSGDRDTKDEKVTLQFDITDTGIGITPEIGSRLFQPFSQGDISTSRKYGGTGLGLVISKRLIEMMGGQINVESCPGKGSQFTFTVQLSVCHSRVPTDDVKAFPQLNGLRILCVDDNGINRDTVLQHAISWKMRCNVAINAAEGLSMLKRAHDENDPYVLVLVDHMMPGMTGLELIQIMRQLPEIAETDAILLVPLGITISNTEIEPLKIGVLNKPLRANSLQEGILSALNHKLVKLGAHVPVAPTPEPTHQRILLAEDNAVNKEMAIRILAKLGYQADAVSNGNEVLRAIKNKQYELILMDCQMPELDGYATSMEIRSKEMNTKTRIPIIAMTAHALRGDREKCIAAGMDDYVSKPISIKTLQTKIERWIGGGGYEDDSPPNHAAPSIIDMERLKTIFGNDTQGIHQFLNVLSEALVDSLKEIEVAIQHKDSLLARQLFHQLKGCTSNAGIKSIAKLCSMAEEKLAVDDWEKVNEYYQSILGLHSRLQIELKAIVQ